MIKKKSFWKSKKTTGAFAMFSLLSGVTFMNQNITGNIVGSSETINFLGLIGVGLIICSIVLAAYSLRAK